METRRTAHMGATFLFSLVLICSPTFGDSWLKRHWRFTCGALLAGTVLTSTYLWVNSLPAPGNGTSVEQTNDNRIEHLRMRARELIERAKHNGQTWESTRGLADYDSVTLGSVKSHLAELGPTDHWIDMGSGDGVALRQYHEQGGQAYTTGLTFQRNAPPTPDPEKMRSLVGRYVEDIPIAEIIGPAGRPKLITDIMGPLAYTSEPQEVLRIYHEVLATGGTAILLIPTVNPVIDEALPSGGANLDEWLLNHGTLFSELPSPKGYTLVAFHKNNDVDFALPVLDVLIYENSTPPLRVFWANHGRGFDGYMPFDATISDKLGPVERAPLTRRPAEKAD